MDRTTFVTALYYCAIILVSASAGLCSSRKVLCLVARVFSWLIVVMLAIELFSTGYSTLALFGTSAAVFLREGLIFLFATMWSSHAAEPLPDYLGVVWFFAIGVSGVMTSCTFLIVVLSAAAKILHLF